MAGPKDIVDQITSVFKGLTATQKIVTFLVVAVVLGGLLMLTTVGPGPTNYKVLFSGMSQEDASEVITWLKEQGIPYKLSEDSRAIMVPASQVYETRLNLAGDGLPRGGGVGFEIFDDVGLGTTDFVNRLNFQRALQGELARTIRQFQQVQEARVHIATPRESIFIEDEKPPTASISVKLRGRDKLSSHQIQSIVNLVASAVPGLTPENVTLVDTAGRLLFRKQGDQDAIMSGTQLEYQFKVEATLRQKVETLLEEIVGVNRARARVTAEIDFSKVNMTEENFDPETQVIRSEQLLTEADKSDESQPQGIPGVKGDLATFSEAEDEAGQGAGFTRSNVTRNYEISKQIRHTQESSGTISRLSVAVMVDGTYEKIVDSEGKTSLQYKARTSDEMRHFENLVKNAIGYDEDRGDQVEVVGMPFALSSVMEGEPEAMDKWRELIEWLAMPIVYLLIAIAFLVFVVRPLLKLLATRRVEPQFSPEMLEKAAKLGIPTEEEDLSLAPKGVTDQERIFRLAQSDPDRAADRVRRWLRQEI